MLSISTKHEVRRLLMDRAVQKEVAVHVPLVSGVFCQSEREPESDLTCLGFSGLIGGCWELRALVESIGFLVD